MRLLPLLALVFIGCMKRPASKSAPEAAYYDDAYGGGYGMSGGASMDAERNGDRGERYPPPSPPPPPMDIVMEESPPEPTPQPSPAPAPAQAQRMVHYDGWARLRVADPPDTLDAVSKLAEDAGGRTERLSGNTVSVRVPVEKFEEVWDQVLALGDLEDQSIRADDVTEQFLAVDLRARTLRATQARLIELLGKATEEEEKLALLQEITRVTEELDAIEVQLRTLSDLAAMSRISVEADPREAFTGSGGAPELAGFEWVRALSPFNRGTLVDDKRVPLDVPEGLVVLAPRGPFAAESPDGVVLWTLRVPNDPVGTADYWVDAAEDRLADEFADPQRKQVGDWECLTVHEPGADEPYTWQVCVSDEGKWLHVAEAYFPGPEQVTRYGAAVDDSLKGGGAS